MTLIAVLEVPMDDRCGHGHPVTDCSKCCKDGQPHDWENSGPRGGAAEVEFCRRCGLMRMWETVRNR